jgi:hypothetical protein
MYRYHVAYFSDVIDTHVKRSPIYFIIKINHSTLRHLHHVTGLVTKVSTCYSESILILRNFTPQLTEVLIVAFKDPSVSYTFLNYREQ